MDTPKIIGILNVNDDSFNPDSRVTPDEAIERANELFAQGADIVDIGVEATNPGVKRALTATEELAKLDVFFPELLAMFPGKISLDTHHARTAEWALTIGSELESIPIINDVTMFDKPRMIELVAEFGGLCIVGHLDPGVQGDIALAHKSEPTKTVRQVRNQLLTKREAMIQAGVAAERIVIDPDIGFGKDRSNNNALNWALLRFAEEVPADIPVAIGASCKRFLGEKRFTPEVNVAAARIALAAGAQYLRVHHVAEHRQLVDEFIKAA